MDGVVRGTVEGTTGVQCRGLVLPSQGLARGTAGGGRGSDSRWGAFFCEEGEVNGMYPNYDV